MKEFGEKLFPGRTGVSLKNNLIEQHSKNGQNWKANQATLLLVQLTSTQKFFSQHGQHDQQLVVKQMPSYLKDNGEHFCHH